VIQKKCFYKENAQSFFADTVAVDMGDLYARFLAAVSAGGHILDAGCGSGRDAKAFVSRGYRVTAFDACAALASLASEHLGQHVAVRSFAEVSELAAYDGIWACASLLHVSLQEMPEILTRLWAALKPGGVLYCSFKVGRGEREHQGRRFTDADEIALGTWLEHLPGVADRQFWRTVDQRPGRSDEWLNGLIRRAAAPVERLVTGGDNSHFLPHLCAAINASSEIDLAVAFIKSTGLRLLLPDLLGALTRSHAENSTANSQITGPSPAARLRIITSDYLDVTDPDALRRLMLLQELGAQVCVYESAGSSFHMKAYLFARFAADGQLQGQAFIGSSNISRQALKDGLEWNYRIDYPGDLGFIEARSRYEELFVHPRAKPLTDAWIDAYEARRIVPAVAIAPGSQELDLPPLPTQIQVDALLALAKTREEGYMRGLVVLATGLGKTWLSAFDAVQAGARRVLFVAHREEILNQAAETFLRVRPNMRVGFYRGQQRDSQVDVLCASVQTLGRATHLERFSPQHFDYIVIDEFHHAAAPTYHRLLNHFAPAFMLGLTATPDRTDQSNILSLCDDNLVFTRNLFAGIQSGLLAPFHYYGVFDEGVDYQEIPWRNGHFDPTQLANKLATLGRARHALSNFRRYAQSKTLAFCVSVRHAEFMAEYFRKQNIQAAAVYASSPLSRGEALEQLADGRLQVIFSVDLFNEGVDLPGIDTVMLLRPTESKILFLQQLGRGLRKAHGKEKLVVLDFIGNHQSFLHKPQALMGRSMTHRDLAAYARDAEAQRLELPDGCFINYDLQLIDFLKSLDGEGVQKDYQALREGFGRRPTLSEFYRSGASVMQARKQFGHWFALVQTMGDLVGEEAALLAEHAEFLREVEVTAMAKSFKMILLEAFQELDGWRMAPTTDALAERSWQVLQRRRPLLADVPPEQLVPGADRQLRWQRYWLSNPVNAWVGGNLKKTAAVFFAQQNQRFVPLLQIPDDQREPFTALVQELVDYRLAAYEVRSTHSVVSTPVVPVVSRQGIELPFFPDLKIACGHFRTSSAESEEYRFVGNGYGQLDASRHFIARASGNSMNGGKQPICDGDYLLLEQINPNSAGSLTGAIMAIERQDEAGDNQYLLRVILKSVDGNYVLRANNADYADVPVTEELREQLRTFARLKAVLNPLELALGQRVLREDIPLLFGAEFNPGSWNVGHVVLPERNAHVLLVTLNKQGKAVEHRYLDHWIDEQTFHWQSQDKTTAESKRGQQITQHEKLGLSIHLFVREHKLENGKAAPFTYHGPVRYRSHTGSAPMSVVFELLGG
jgi:superfamily II DNA or RNA helicase/HKD family nuclease